MRLDHDGCCPACSDAIPEHDRAAHSAGRDLLRLDCPAQDLEAIREQERSADATWSRYLKGGVA